MQKVTLSFYLAIFIIVLLPITAFAQNTEERYKRIESAKIALITERLQLKPEQAEKFWPVYNQYQSEKKSLRRKSKEERWGSQDNLTETRAKEILDQRYELKKQELALDEKYIPQLVQVTSAKQILALERAEIEFRRILLQKLRNKK